MRWVVLALALTACSTKPSASDCEKAANKMLDIFAEPRLAPGVSSPAELDKLTDSWRKILEDKDKDPTRALLVDTCRKKMTKEHVECIDHAVDEKALAKCFSG